MDARGDGVPAAAAVTVEAGDGELSGQAGVDFAGVAGSMGSSGDGDLRPRDLFGPGGGVTGLGSKGLTGVDLRPQGLFGPADGGPDRAGGPVAGVRGPGSPQRLVHPLFSGVDPVPAAFAPAAGDDPPQGRGQDPLCVVVLRDMPAGFVRAGGDRGWSVRPAALLAMLLGAVTLIGEPDAPWPYQFGALLVWFAGCIALFLLSRH